MLGKTTESPLRFSDIVVELKIAVAVNQKNYSNDHLNYDHDRVLGSEDIYIGVVEVQVAVNILVSPVEHSNFRGCIIENGKGREIRYRWNKSGMEGKRIIRYIR